MQAIVAVSQNWGIGRDNGLLFDIPEDMAFFRETTLNSTVIMGRNTLASLPGGKPLKGRRNIVLSTRKDFAPEGVEVAGSPQEACEMTKDDPRVFVIGGAQIYEAMLDYCDKAFVTMVDAAPPCDRFFPNLDEDPRWERAETGPDLRSGDYTFRFVTFVRKK